MDLASTPTIPHSSERTAVSAPERLRDREKSVRLLDANQASAPQFLAHWQKLVRCAAEPNPFFEPWFLLPSLAHLADEEHPAIFTTWHGDQLTGLLPLARPKDYYGYRLPHAASWLHANAFCGSPLVAAGHEQQFWRNLLSHLDYAPGSALLLHCAQLPENGALNAALAHLLSETGRRSVVIDTAERAVLTSDLSPDDYLTKAMSSKKRKELRRQHKRLCEEGDLQFERVEDASGIEQWVADFLALEAAGWKGEAGSALGSEGHTRSFFTETLTGAAKAGRLERLALRLDGKPIAMLANFITPPGVFSFKTAFDEAYARFSPGLLLQIENLDLLTRADVEWADSCAVQGHSMIERIWRDKRRIISRNIAIGGPLRRTLFRALAAYETRGKTP